MSTFNDGGPAFPGEQGRNPNGEWNETWNPGMTLRQWYVGMALQGMLAGNEHLGGMIPREYVKYARAIADVILAKEG